MGSLLLAGCAAVGSPVSTQGCKHDQMDAAPSQGATAATSGAEAEPAAVGGGGGGGTPAAGSGGQPNATADSDAGPAPSDVLAFEAAIQSYKSWTPATPEPQAIAVEIASLCRAPSAAEQAFVGSVHGQNLYVHDWLNPQVVASRDAAVSGGKVHFAPGAAIVKQKLALDANGKRAVVALGIMIKREPGFDAAHGDWAFGYWGASFGLKAGPEEASHCGDCHKSSAASDFVFLDQSWRTTP
jgi:hypothetical protein